MRLLVILLTLIPATLLGSADVYRWTDANGQSHYSDMPQPGAERITIAVSRPASGSPDGISPAATEDSDDSASSPFVRYQSLTITSPAQEQTVWNIEGQMDVAASVQPSLQPDHVLQFTLDGRTVAAEPGSTQARFSEVFRGEHSLQVEVVNAAGQTLVASPTTRFFVRQTALPNPVQAPAPGPPRPTPVMRP